MTAPSHGRRRLIVLLAAVAVVAAAWRVTRHRTPPSPSAAAVPRPAASPSPSTIRPAVDPVQLAAAHQQMTTEANLIAYRDAYLAATRYPPTTLPLLPGMIDALEPDRIVAHDRPMPGVRNLAAPTEQRIYYRFEADRSRVIGAGALTLRLTVFRGLATRAAVAARVEPVEVRRLAPDGRQIGLGSVALAEVSPGVYEARYPLPRRRGATEDDLLRFAARWSLVGGGARPGAAELYAMHTAYPAARFTGAVTDRVVDGSLVISVEIDSARAGRAEVAANLVSAGDGAPIASVVVHRDLPIGRTWVDLPVYGLAIRERGIAGRYRVSALRGFFPSTESAGRGGELARAPDDHVTASYQLAQFTDQEWTSPEKRLALAAYDQEIAQAPR